MRVIPDVGELIRQEFARVGGDGCLHARRLAPGDGPDVDVEADQPIPAEPAFSIALALAGADAAERDQWVGLSRVQQILTGLGMFKTCVLGCCEQVATAFATAGPPAPDRASTPRETTRLLAGVWDAAAASPAACRHVRRLLAEQAGTQASYHGFDDGTVLAGVTGPPGSHCEALVVGYADGTAYAVAVSSIASAAAATAAAGARARAARLAVQHLRRFDPSRRLLVGAGQVA